MTDPYQCQSYYDEENVLRDCSCGKCGLDSLNAPTHHSEVEGLVAEYERMQVRYKRRQRHACATCGEPNDHGVDSNYTHQYDEGLDTYDFPLDWLRTALTTHSAKEYERGKREGTYHAWMDAIELSDKLEESNTKFDEWRAFKGFRNALHDKIATLTHKA